MGEVALSSACLIQDLKVLLQLEATAALTESCRKPDTHRVFRSCQWTQSLWRSLGNACHSQVSVLLF